jgi:hypothetical protein
MDAYCSLEDAFLVPGPVPKKKKSRTKEIPAELSGDLDRSSYRKPPPAEVLESSHESAPPATANSTEFFPLPGNTTEPDAWEKAFMLQPDWAKTHGMPSVSAFSSNNAMAVDGKSTLWRKIPVPQETESAQSTQFSEMNARLEELTRQLESLSIPTPVQSTAELFLFVAIGLMILLSIDTLLRFATTMATKRFSLLNKGNRIRTGLSSNL